jgi:hypothetical protein
MGFDVRLRPLAACLALATGTLAAAPPDARIAAHRAFGAHAPVPAGAIVVTSCDDDGPGTLRNAVSIAASGDTIDLTQLDCSTITLTTGAIGVAQDDLALIGPGAALLAIDGNGASSLMRHSGAGTLSFDSLTLTHGHFAQYYAHGGCLFSQGNIALYRSVVSDCVVAGGFARGGGIFAVHDLTIVDSVVTGNLADGGTLDASGGGFLVGGYLHFIDSTLSNNTAQTAPPPTGTFSVGGGADTFGDVLIMGSTISGNQAKNVAGIVFEAHGSPTAVMVDSTVSGNMPVENGPFGGVYAGIPFSAYNSTIAFNGGFGLTTGYALYLKSTIIADNVPPDLFIEPGGTVSGTNNLVVRSSIVPPDTLRGCPLLRPLADNGGLTLTHALIGSSPAIDAGDNVRALPNDQRGDGYPRVFGDAADIGAFEWQGGFDDPIFSNAFEIVCTN